MTDGVRVQVLGADTLARTAAQAATQLGALSGAGRAAGALLVGRAAARAPRRTGRLAASVQITAMDPAGGVTVGSPVLYAPYQNFGTRYVRPTFFLTGALTDNTDQVTDVYAAAVDQAVGTIRGQ